MIWKGLWANLLRKELCGIDDCALIDAIGKSCFRRISSSLTTGDLLVFLIVLCVGIGANAAADVLGLRGGQAGYLVGFMGVAILSAWLRRRAKKMLPEVLQSMGRCIRCGYKLDPETAKQCPECGTSTQNRVAQVDRT